MSSKNSEQNIQEEELKDAQTSDSSQEQEASAQAEEQENQEQPEESAEEAEEPANEVEQLQEEVSKLKDQHLRLFADFENYKKRTAKERIELFGTANIELMSALLPVLDDFKRALKPALAPLCGFWKLQEAHR